MTWFFIAIGAYLLNAIAIAIDKFLLTKKIPNPVVYTFFISALSLLGLVLIPFGFHLPALGQIIISLLSGVIFTLALLFMFKAIGANEASRVAPFMGGLQPIFIFILAWIFLGERLGGGAIIGFLIIILGTIIISRETGKTQGRLTKKSYFFALVSTILFALAYTLNKYIYLEQGFITGFVLTRLGAFIGALFLLLSPTNRRDVGQELQGDHGKIKTLFLFGQASGAASFILINYDIAISKSVALINGLQGVQYVFLIIILVVLAKRWPKISSEKFTTKILAQKLAATVFIVIGLLLIFLK